MSDVILFLVSLILAYLVLSGVFSWVFEGWPVPRRVYPPSPMFAVYPSYRGFAIREELCYGNSFAFHGTRGAFSMTCDCYDDLVDAIDNWYYYDGPLPL